MADGVRSALIVASDVYDDPGLRRLRAPAHDAEALGRVLGNPQIGGFEVRTLLNEPVHVIKLAVEDFFADRGLNDLLLLHISCHGVKDEAGELHFATTSTELRRLASTSVEADFVNRRMTRSRSRRIVLLLDCCYAGAFERGMTPRAGSGMGIDEQFGGRGRAVITASSAMEYAFEGEALADADALAPSVFTTALVEGLETGEADQDQDGVVALSELYDYVYRKVRETTPYQTPSRWMFGLEGELHIARRARPVTTPTPLPTELQQALDSLLASVRKGAVQDLARLLHGRHAGLALAARLALEHLTHDDSRTVAAEATAALATSTPSDLAEPHPLTSVAEPVTWEPTVTAAPAGDTAAAQARSQGDRLYISRRDVEAVFVGEERLARWFAALIIEADTGDRELALARIPIGGRLALFPSGLGFLANSGQERLLQGPCNLALKGAQIREVRTVPRQARVAGSRPVVEGFWARIDSWSPYRWLVLVTTKGPLLFELWAADRRADQIAKQLGVVRGGDIRSRSPATDSATTPSTPSEPAPSPAPPQSKRRRAPSRVRWPGVVLIVLVLLAGAAVAAFIAATLQSQF
jgi:hypothetical protein